MPFVQNKLPCPNITQDLLKDLLHYDKDSGVFTWKVDRGRAKIGLVAGTVDRDGYIIIRFKGKGYKAHRLAWLYIKGRWPVNQIDHINQIKDDNSISNLRDVTISENAQNRTIHRDNKSGFTGVHWNKLDNRWRAVITINGKVIQLGQCKLKEDAIQLRQTANVLYGFHENHGAVKC